MTGRAEDAEDMRLELLTSARQFFVSGRTFEEFTLTEQQCETGLLQPTQLDGVDWGYFGQMSAHGSYNRVLGEHAGLLSQALDKIPLVDPVTRRHYEAFAEVFQRSPTPRATSALAAIARRCARRTGGDGENISVSTAKLFAVPAYVPHAIRLALG